MAEKSPLTTPASSRDISLTALALSGVARLQHAFFETTSEHQRRALLQGAADLMDRTLPFPALKQQLLSERPTDQVAFLIAHRAQIATVPPNFWHPLKVRLSDLPSAHYSGMKALERALRLDFSDVAKTWSVLEAWLAPVWGKYPTLKEEAAVWKKDSLGGGL